MRDLRLIALPFHDGLPGVAMGAGPRALMGDVALREDLLRGGWKVGVEEVPPADATRPEVARTIELDRRLAKHVAAALEAGAYPLVLGGGCNACLGAVAGVGGGERLGAVWFDAHADFDTPQDNLSGFFDVMTLAALTGSAWQAQAATIEGFAPIAEEHVVLAGVRDLEPYQRERMERSALRVVGGEVDPAQLDAALDGLREQVSRVYLHLDLDALDLGEGRANAYAATGGPSLARYLEAIDAVFDRFEVPVAALTAYDPTYDTDGRAGDAATALLRRVAQRAAEA